MKIISSNAMKIFTRNKGLFFFILIQPIFMFLLMSFLLPYTTTHNIAVISIVENEQNDRIEGAIRNIEGVKLLDVSLDEVDDKLIGGNIELAVLLDDKSQVEIVSAGGSEVEGAITLCVKQALSEDSDENLVAVNEAPKKGRSLSGSLGFMIYKTLTGGDVLAMLIISERKNKMKDRILLSGTKTGSYLGGISSVYLIFVVLSSAVYYLCALVLGFDFGMRNSLGFLLMLIAASVLTTAIYLFAGTVLKNEEGLWVLATFILTPMGLFSGLLFPYQLMPKVMQTIGSFFPHRWIAQGIENMQQYGRISSALPQIALILGASAIFFILATRFCGLKGQSLSESHK